MLQAPVVTKLKAPPVLIVHTPVVDEVKVGVKPELAVAFSVGVVPKLCAPGLAKLMVCTALGVTALEDPEAELAPDELIAVTVKV